MTHLTLKDFGQKLPQVVTSFLDNSVRPLLVVTGPTGSGKTSFSLDLAELLQKEKGKGVEVVNADSRQCYEHLNVGTAKIRPEEMRGIPHRLIDVLDPTEEATIAWYKDQAECEIGSVLRKGNIPMMVGGSMLYISAVIDGLEPLPSSPEIRNKLKEEYDKDDGKSLMERLEEIDPESASGIPIQNKAYLVRAVEIFETTGKPASEAKRAKGSDYDLLILCMDVPRDELIEHINQRTKKMLNEGWIEEVQSLLEKGYTTNDPGMKSHGYREIIAWIESGSSDRSKLEEDVSSKVRRYAKRQMTWWRNDPRVHWVNI